jgi:hypothetical protein
MRPPAAAEATPSRTPRIKLLPAWLPISNNDGNARGVPDDGDNDSS